MIALPMAQSAIQWSFGENLWRFQPTCNQINHAEPLMEDAYAAIVVGLLIKLHSRTNERLCGIIIKNLKIRDLMLIVHGRASRLFVVGGK